MIVYEVVAITGHLGVVAIGHRWALRQLETGTGFFVSKDERPLTWASLAEVDKWLQSNQLQDTAIVIWPPQVLLGGRIV